MRSPIKNLHWIDISILLLALIVGLLGIGSYGLYEPHEGHFAMVGQVLLSLGNGQENYGALIPVELRL